MSESIIRKVKANDLPQIINLEDISFKNPYPSSIIKSLSILYPNLFLVAEKSEKITGYLIASNYKNLGYLLSIAVHPSERRKSIGRSLINRIFKILKNEGVTTIRLEVRRNNLIARKFYEKLGFKSAHTIPSYYGEEDAIVYLKEIQ